MSPLYTGVSGIIYDPSDGGCRGMKWCAACKTRALAELHVKSGIWWELHERRGTTCPMCNRPDCNAAKNHNNPCQHTFLGPPTPAHMIFKGRSTL